ncbi:uncharacterized protein F4812DRAFT_469158 [Daldinia caldariorum]|uniref:uncharacterized protein n=1 Tax=Daldinia caldariorum TaxID=326644 RepID=UPI002008217D|nr:uncharacterized protein F4812DRAFT_469158 [Daldinia caldariorum]KAI1470588.1 hypothetical protein F4812DRAFT_469158 [Daldinia caldariorum]
MTVIKRTPDTPHTEMSCPYGPRTSGFRGDSPEPELDDLAHKEEPHQARTSDEVCSWQGDPPEPELDDLAHSAEPSHGSQTNLRVEPLLAEVESTPLDTPLKPENHKEPSKAHFEDEDPEGQKQEDVPEETLRGETLQEQTLQEQTLQERITHGVQQALTVFQNIIHPHSEAHEEAPEDSTEPPGRDDDYHPALTRGPPILTIVELQKPKGTKLKEDKEKAKREKAEAKKAEKEKKAQEKEEKKKLKAEKEKERKEQRRLEKGRKKNKGKEAEPPPDLPPGANGRTAVESHRHPGCQICQHPEEQGTDDFMKDLVDGLEGVPSINDLTDAAKKLLGTKEADDATANAKQNPQSYSLNEQELIEHIAAHIDRHIHRYIDLKPPGAGGGEENASAEEKPPANVFPYQTPYRFPGGQAGTGAPNRQYEGREDVGVRPPGHGLDGNRDWPLTVMQGHVLRSTKPMSTPDVATAPAPSPPRDFSPFRSPTNRCVSPWCEKLGLKLDDPPLFHKRTVPWSRRGFNSSPSRMRTTTTPTCFNTPLCAHPVYHEHGLYACVPVSLVPALRLESPCCGHASCCHHYTSPIVTPLPVSHTPRPLFNFEPFGAAETIPPCTPRRSLSANETQIIF